MRAVISNSEKRIDGQRKCNEISAGERTHRFIGPLLKERLKCPGGTGYVVNWVWEWQLRDALKGENCRCF
eukprot:Skav232424  [mRNA]  locus=scaffold189:112231:114146:- [translate_table: standard]